MDNCNCFQINIEQILTDWSLFIDYTNGVDPNHPDNETFSFTVGDPAVSNPVTTVCIENNKPITYQITSCEKTETFIITYYENNPENLITCDCYQIENIVTGEIVESSGLMSDCIDECIIENVSITADLPCAGDIVDIIVEWESALSGDFVDITYEIEYGATTTIPMIPDTSGTYTIQDIYSYGQNITVTVTSSSEPSCFDSDTIALPSCGCPPFSLDSFTISPNPVDEGSTVIFIASITNTSGLDTDANYTATLTNTTTVTVVPMTYNSTLGQYEATITNVDSGDAGDYEFYIEYDTDVSCNYTLNDTLVVTNSTCAFTPPTITVQCAPTSPPVYNCGACAGVDNIEVIVSGFSTPVGFTGPNIDVDVNGVNVCSVLPGSVNGNLLCIDVSSLSPDIDGNCNIELTLSDSGDPSCFYTETFLDVGCTCRCDLTLEGDPLTICLGDTPDITLIASTDTPASVFQWKDYLDGVIGGETSDTLVMTSVDPYYPPAVAGTYTYKVSTSIPPHAVVCPEISIVVEVIEIEGEVECVGKPDCIYCEGETITLSPSLTSSGSIVSVDWLGTGSYGEVFYTTGDLVLENMEVGFYYFYITITDSNGCELNIPSFEFIVNPCSEPTMIDDCEIGYDGLPCFSIDYEDEDCSNVIPLQVFYGDQSPYYLFGDTHCPCNCLGNISCTDIISFFPPMLADVRIIETAGVYHFNFSVGVASGANIVISDILSDCISSGSHFFILNIIDQKDPYSTHTLKLYVENIYDITYGNNLEFKYDINAALTPPDICYDTVDLDFQSGLTSLSNVSSGNTYDTINVCCLTYEPECSELTFDYNYCNPNLPSSGGQYDSVIFKEYNGNTLSCDCFEAYDGNDNLIFSDISGC